MANQRTGLACGIVVAAGRSERMGGVDKVFAQLAGRPLLAWTLAAFKRCDAIDGIVVVASEVSLQRMYEFVREWRFDAKVKAVVPGGATRQESVRAGLDAAGSAAIASAIVAVHDGARPLVTPDIIARGVALARETGAALCAVPARDTVKQVEGDPPVVTGTPAREGLWLAQTPQCFDRELLLKAHREAGNTPATDDAALVEALGHAVTVYEGAWSNFKVTTQEDMIIAEALLRERFASGA
ncbi:MAG: 2-C-methyl-D-erythritol 4-phosphate cytidylyltransferase [Chloroflexi bacterium]|nr:2-C-methyl-D-erythritol 4-phosphate cytidylyltransferase [Chloroflexota bacterium]